MQACRNLPVSLGIITDWTAYPQSMRREYRQLYSAALKPCQVMLILPTQASEMHLWQVQPTCRCWQAEASAGQRAAAPAQPLLRPAQAAPRGAGP